MMDARADRTALRLQLYENGFTPLANRNKACFIHGWSTIEVTPEIIESREWARSRSFLDTGVRCGDVVALDWDIDDSDLLNDMLDAAIERGLIAESTFVRIGMPPRELWVYRTSDRIGRRTTGHFATAEQVAADPHTKGYAVEVLGAGCQFAAYGQRDADHAYAWPVDSLLDHQYMDLPEINREQVDALVAFAAAFFEERGLSRLSTGAGTDAGYTHIYDLTPDMTFNVRDVGTLTLAEIGEYLSANPDDVLRCTVETLRPGTSGSWAGMISLVDGDVCISDHGSYTSHFPVELDIRASVARLGELLAQRLPTPPVAAPTVDGSKLLAPLDPTAGVDANLRVALERFVYIENADIIHDVSRSSSGMRPEHFRTFLRQHYVEEQGARGGRRFTWLADLWMQHPERMNAATMGVRPDRPWPTYIENGHLHVNTYRPLFLPAHGDPQPGFDFLARLLPDEAERTYFTRWLAHKIRNPADRGPAIVMVAHDTYGTGRGSLVNLVRSMFSPGLVQNVSFKTLSGQTYQSQYNEWLADSLLVAVDEAQESMANVSRWAMRNNAYEHLKEIVDPANHDIHVTRKGVPNAPGHTYASILVMTNHMDSIVIPENDRRFAILTNGAPPPPEYWAEFHAWRLRPENVGAFMAALQKIDMGDYSPFAPPPMTLAKTEMVEAGTSALDKAITFVLREFSDTLLVKEQVLWRVEDYLSDHDAEVPDDWRRTLERVFSRKTRRIPTANDRVRIDGKQRTVRMLGSVAPEVLQSGASMLQEVLRNGPITRPVRTSGQVVQFPAR